MTEWKIIESDNFPELAEGETVQPTRRLRRRWLRVVAGIGLLLVAIGAVFRWQLADRNNALCADLEVAILKEETLRYLGQPEKIAITSDTPPEWKRAYWQLEWLNNCHI